MTAPPRLSLVTLAANDVAALADFYERLGWPCSRIGDDFARFDTGGAILCVYTRALLAQEASLPPGADDAGLRIGLASNVSAKEDVDPAVEAWRAAGATVLAEGSDRFWGGRSGYVADPEGNAWEIAWNPDITYDARGNPSWPVD